MDVTPDPQHEGFALVEETPGRVVKQELVPAFPGGLSGVVRCIGWQIDFADGSGVDMVTPILEGDNAG